MKMKTFKNGKITVNDKSVQISYLLGNSTVIQRDDIESVNAMGNIFIAIINMIFIVGIYKGIRMLTGNKLVTIKRYDDKEIAFWMPSHEVAAFKAAL